MGPIKIWDQGIVRPRATACNDPGSEPVVPTVNESHQRRMAEVDRMHHFNESLLVKHLELLARPERIAFAVAVAGRQLSSYERYILTLEGCVDRRPFEIVAQLWDQLRLPVLGQDEWTGKVNEIMERLPDENDKEGIHVAFADDALSSLAYAIRCYLNSESQEAAWAAKRAYEAADQAAIRLLDGQSNTQSSEADILGHELVQLELERQLRDLALLQEGAIDDVREHSSREQLLTEKDVENLSRIESI